MKEQLISFETAREFLYYNPKFGYILWKKKPSPKANRIAVGQLAGYINQVGDIRIAIKGKEYKAHRLAWLLHYGKFPKDEIDHINGNRADNSIRNLRDVAHRENMSNQKQHRKGRDLPVGVSRHPNSQKYHARAYKNGKCNHIGLYKTVEQAKEAYLKFIQL